MKPTISTFLFTTIHFVLARSSVATTIALPPVMAAFPFIPVLAYTLIISAFSYISARILKHFNFKSDLLTFLRRKGRFTQLPITHSHELLPTSTATPSATPSIGVYAASSNVTIPRSASLDTLPVPTAPSPRLISPASSPPRAARSQLRRVPNPSLASFSILKPTVYRHKHRRSRSLGVPIPRPEHWPSLFLPSPPTQQIIINDGRRRNSEDDIPLALLSLTTAHPPMFEPSPMLQEPPISAPPLLMPDPYLHASIHGPLIDISPLSPDTTSSSSHQSSPLADLPSSSTDLALNPTSSDSSSPSWSTQDSDIGAQPMDELGGFAYDWGFDNANARNPPLRAADRYGPFKLPLLPNGADEQHNAAVAMVGREEGYDRCSEGSNFERQNTGGVDQAVYVAVRNVPDEVSSAPVVVQWDIPSSGGVGNFDYANSESDPITEEDILRISVLTSESVSKITSARSEDLVDKCVTIIEGLDKTRPADDGMSLKGGTTSERLGDLRDGPLVVENINIEDRPTIIVDISDSSKASDSLLSKGVSPLSPSQIPTPPASPPHTPISITRSSTSSSPQLVAATDSSISNSISPDSEIATAKTPLELEVAEDEANCVMSPQEGQEREDVITPAITLDLSQKRSSEQNGPLSEDVAGIPTKDNFSPTGSFSDGRPAWSVRAADAPPLGLSKIQAASVQEEVAWPRKMKTMNMDAEIVRVDEGSEVNASKKSDESVEHKAIQASALLESKLSVPGSFPEAESGPTQEQTTNLSASSTVVPTVSSVARRRQDMRALPIDVALAMQMRPGLGVGADPAWMVRFLMAVFGWFAIMIAGRGGEVDIYAS